MRDDFDILVFLFIAVRAAARVAAPKPEKKKDCVIQEKTHRKSEGTMLPVAFLLFFFVCAESENCWQRKSKVTFK